MQDQDVLAHGNYKSILLRLRSLLEKCILEQQSGAISLDSLTENFNIHAKVPSQSFDAQASKDSCRTGKQWGCEVHELVLSHRPSQSQSHPE
jgi:hypothetical protein